MTLSAIGLTDGNIMVGDISDIGADVAMSGDVTIDNTGATTIKTNVALAGNPTTTTQSPGDNSTNIATTAYVDTGLAGKASSTLTNAHLFVGNGSNVATDTAITGDVTISNTGVTAIKSSVALAGSPTTTTQSPGDNSTKIATTAYVDTGLAGKASSTLTSAHLFVGNGSNVATDTAITGDVTISNTGATAIKTNVALAGSPTTTTQSAGDNSTKIATTAYVDTGLAGKASSTLTNAHLFVGNGSNVATDTAITGDVTISNTGVTAIKSSVALAGSPTTTTQSPGDDSTKIATTAYVDTGLAGKSSSTLTNAHLFVGNGSNVATDTAITGDVTISNTGVTAIKTSVALAGSPTTTTQSPGDDSTKIATTAYVDTGLAGKSSSTLTSAHLFIGNGSNVATDTAITGDVTISNTGATSIGASKVTNTMLAGSIAASKLVGTDIATVGTITSGTWNGTAITGSYIASSVALAGSPTTTTQSAGDNSTKIATTAYVDAAAGSGVKTVINQSFTASGTYTPSAGMLYCIVEGVGGGGGGGYSGSATVPGAGGGGGGYSRAVLTAAQIGSSKAVTIGAGGNGGNSGNGWASVSGGDTSLGTLLVAKGGTRGADVTISQGGAGGVAGTGDFTSPGGAGGPSVYWGGTGTSKGMSGNGGNSQLGFGGAALISSGVGVNGSSYGAGGGGAWDNAGWAGNGASGILFITEYCS